MWPMPKPRGKATAKAKPPRPLKDDVIRFRVTAEEKAGLEGEAARQGMVLSAWLRRLALQAAGMLRGASNT